LTDISTTVITTTECKENICSEVPITTGFAVIKTTSHGVVTEYTTFCPLTTTKVAPTGTETVINVAPTGTETTTNVAPTGTETTTNVAPTGTETEAITVALPGTETEVTTETEATTVAPPGTETEGTIPATTGVTVTLSTSSEAGVESSAAPSEVPTVEVSNGANYPMVQKAFMLISPLFVFL
jgi:hypothetical protein